VRVAGSDSNTYADAARNEILTYVGNLVVIEHQVDVVRYDVNTILVETGEIVAENVMSGLADDCPTLGNLDYRVRRCWYASDSCNQQDESECTGETGNYAVPVLGGSARGELHGLFLSLDTKRMDPAGGVLRLMLSDYRSAGRHDSCIFGCSAWRWPVRGNSSGNGGGRTLVKGKLEVKGISVNIMLIYYLDSIPISGHHSFKIGPKKGTGKRDNRLQGTGYR